MPCETNSFDQEYLQHALHFETYSSGWIPGSTADTPSHYISQKIADFFRKNYPSMYDPDVTQHDLSRYQTAEQILEQIQHDNTWITATEGQEIVGILKFRQETRTQTPQTIEILISWVMVDENHRKRGIASTLIQKTISSLSSVKNQAEENRVYVIADVHHGNDASQKMFSSLGFTEEPGKSEEYILVRKEV